MMKFIDKWFSNEHCALYEVSLAWN